jgi:hypothetical protein
VDIDRISKWELEELGRSYPDEMEVVMPKENKLPGQWDQGGKQGGSKDGPKPSPQPDQQDLDPHHKGEERVDNKNK